MSVMSVALAIFGALLLIAGAVMLVFRRRVAVNMPRAGIVEGTRMSPKNFSVLTSVMLLILGAGTLILTLLTSFRSRDDRFFLAMTALADALGTGGVMLGICLIAAGIAGMLFGVRHIRRAWQSRSTWKQDSSGTLVIPVRDRARIGGGTLLGTFSAIATIFGILLLAAYSVGV